MTGRSNNYIKLFLNFIKITVVFLTVLVIASCPEPMTDELLAEVEDVVGPVITITSPDQSVQNFIESQVIIVGTILDYSDTSGNIEGSVSNAVYADKYAFLDISGNVDIADDGIFTINFDSDHLLSTFTVVITVTDWNNNTTVQEVTYWKDDTGPYIIVDNHDLDDFNDYSSSLGSAYVITGLVGIDAIDMEYDIEWSGANLIDESPSSFNAGSEPFSMSFIPSNYTGTLRFWLRAIDDDGNESSKIFSLYDDPDAPTIVSSPLAFDNSYITLTLDEGVYAASGGVGAGAIDANDFTLVFDQNGGSATGAVITGLQSPSAEADTSFQINIAVTGIPDGNETITLLAAGSSIYDRVGNPSVFTTGSINLNDQKSPTVTGVSQISANLVVVSFSEDIHVTQAENEDNYWNNSAHPTIASRTATDEVTLTFSTVNTVAGLDIDGGVIRDSDANYLAAVSAEPILDAVSPTINSIDSSSGSGPFNDTDIITIDVHFDEFVTLAGTAVLVLDSGGTASCFDTSGTDLTFTYNIGSGNLSNDLTVTALTGGTIIDSSLNILDRTLPAGNNLGDNESIIIDAVDPTVTIDTGAIIYLNSSGNLNATANDTGSGISSYAWSGSANFGNSSSEDTTVTGTSESTQTLTLTVIDNAGNSAIDTIDLVWDVTDPVITMGSDLILGIAGNATAATSDGGSGIASWQWSGSPAGVSFGSATAEDTSVSAGSDGTYTLTLEVTDNAGNVFSDTLSMIWDETAPNVFAGDDKTAGTESLLSSLAGSDSDVTDAGSGGIASYSWTEEGTSKVTITNQNALDPTVNVMDDTEGDYILRLTVFDNAGNSSYGEMTLTWDNGPKLTDIVLNDKGENEAASGDTIVFTFDEAVNITPDSGSLAGMIALVGSFTGPPAATADNTALTLSIGDTVVTITLGGTVVDGSEPSGTFNALPAIEDSTGNTVHSSTNVSISNGHWDEISPSVSSYTVSPGTVTISGTNITIDVVYDEAMDTGVYPIIGFTDQGTAVITFNSRTWVNSTTLSLSYKVVGTATGIKTVDVSVNGAKDVIGNTQNPYSSADKFTINIP